MQEEFTQTRKSGKLPPEAIALLKAWWSAHITWPYPEARGPRAKRHVVPAALHLRAPAQDADKAALQKEAKLTMTQINNWFINQRKRHWQKLFEDRPPETEEAARGALIKRYGSLANAVGAMGQA